MAYTKGLILSSWNREDEHINRWGKASSYYGQSRGYRDTVEVDSEGNKTYSLWGTPLCYKTKDNEFYFYATDLGSPNYGCMSQTSKERINNLLNCGSVVQRRGVNYYYHWCNTKGIKLSMCHWYKVDNGKVEKAESLYISNGRVMCLSAMKEKL